MARWLYNNHVTDKGVPGLIEDYTQWAVWDDWGIPKGEFMRWWRLGIEKEEIYAKGPLIAGARDALWRLSDAEWNIHLATSRFTKFGLHDKIVGNTCSWLRDNNIPYRQLSFTDRKTRIYADAIVDDRLDNMNPKVHGICMMFDAPHNQAQEFDGWGFRVKSWDEVVKRLL
jgi:5'(3')-deoxyribonucleotidase